MKSDGAMFDRSNWRLLFDGFKPVPCSSAVPFDGYKYDGNAWKRCFGLFGLAADERRGDKAA